MNNCLISGSVANDPVPNTELLTGTSLIANKERPSSVIVLRITSNISDCSSTSFGKNTNPVP